MARRKQEHRLEDLIAEYIAAYELGWAEKTRRKYKDDLDRLVAWRDEGGPTTESLTV